MAKPASHIMFLKTKIIRGTQSFKSHQAKKTHPIPMLQTNVITHLYIRIHRWKKLILILKSKLRFLSFFHVIFTFHLEDIIVHMGKTVARHKYAKEVRIFFFPTNLVCASFLHGIEFVKNYEWGHKGALEDIGMKILLSLSIIVEKTWSENALLLSFNIFKNDLTYIISLDP